MQRSRPTLIGRRRGGSLTAGGAAAGGGVVDLNMDLVQMDVTDQASVTTTVQHLIAKAGRIGTVSVCAWPSVVHIPKLTRALSAGGRADIVVNNAGYGLYGPLVEADMTTVRKQYETNVFGALAVCQVSLSVDAHRAHSAQGGRSDSSLFPPCSPESPQAVAPDMMRRRAGKIVNIGSISGIAATPFAGLRHRVHRSRDGALLCCSHL